MSSTNKAWPTLDAQGAYRCYEQWRHRMPAVYQGQLPEKTTEVANILDLLDQVDVFVFDAFGVLNTGTTVVAGAPDVLAELKQRGKVRYVLSNGASNNRAGSLAKLHAMGFDVEPDELVSSRDVCEQWLPHYPTGWEWGVIGRREFEPAELPVRSRLLGDDEQLYDRVDAFLFLSTTHWSMELQSKLEQSLALRPRPLLVANPDVVAPFVEGFSIEPGYFGHTMADAFDFPTGNLPLLQNSESDLENYARPFIEFFGKPYANVFDAVAARAAEKGFKDPTRICMVGDTLHTDILGGLRAGWQSALVTDHGLFRGLDAYKFINDCGIRPHWMMPSIA